MANITNEQRSGLIRIIEENGRGAEFFEKFGKKATAEDQKAADAIAKELTLLKGDEDSRYSSERAEERELENKQYAERNALDEKYNKLKREAAERREQRESERRGKCRELAKKLKALGFSEDSDYVDGKYVTTVVLDTSATNAEYAMFKKRALAGVWGAETLEAANKAIQKYLDLEQ